MSRFVLTAQLQLQAPNNVAQVVRQIQNQLNNVSVNVQVQGAAQAQRQLQQVTTQTQAATTAADRMGRAFAVSIRRFAAFSIATRAVGLFTSTLSDAIQTAINFEREMIRVSQVTGKALGELKSFTKSVTDLSTGLGVASSDLLQAGQLLLQAGISAKDTEVALKTLAKAALAPNFDSLSETTEGAIAILAQFGEGVGALEKQLGAINAVAGAFAVEAGDLIDVIRRAGGVFKSSGGDLNELIALFTSVRATTRESAESIGTGLRTIFTRIQRPKTIEFLKQFGVELVDLEGKFVGPYEAVRRLSTALAGLGEGDITFIRIAEELGGFRQIGKVLPLLQQFTTAQNALNVANKAGNSLTQDAATAQQALAIRILKVKEEFLALIRSVTETQTFQIMANTALTLASALIKIGEAIKPLLPMLAALAAVNFARGISTFAGGMMRGMQSGRTFNKGGKVHHFARGGMVPGTGNRDTVPAMLSPGEFVIKKSSVNRLGASNLAAMNENKYADGGKIQINPGAIGGFFLRPEKGQDRPVPLDFTGSIANPKVLKQLNLTGGKGLKELRQDAFYNATKEQQAKILGLPFNTQTKKITEKDKIFDKTGKFIPRFRGALLNSGYKPTTDYDPNIAFQNLNRKTKSGKLQLSEKKPVNITGTLSSYFPGMDDLQTSSVSQVVADNTKKALQLAIMKSVEPVIQTLSNPTISLNKNLAKKGANRIANDPNAQATTQGFIFEGLIQAITGAKLAGNQSNFDFPSSSIGAARNSLRGMFANVTGEGIDSLIKADAKRSNSRDAIDSIKNKIVNDINKGKLEGLSIQKFASGGGVGSDTIPALLTPGEFVVNRSSAQRIGYGNLNRMNKVAKYAKGGIVQRFAGGGTATAPATSTIPSGSLAAWTAATTGVNNNTKAINTNTTAQKSAAKTAMDVVSNNKMFAASMVTSLIQGFLPAVDDNSSAMLRLSHSMLGLVTTVASVGFALEAFGVNLSAKNIMEFFGSGPNSAGGLLTKGFKSVGPKLGSAIGSIRSGINKRGNAILSPFSRGASAIAGPISQKASSLSSSFGAGFQGGRRGISPLFAAAKANNPFVGTSGQMGISSLRTGINQLGIGGRLAARAGGIAGRAKTTFEQSAFGQGFGGGRKGINPLFAAAKARSPFVGMGGSMGVSALQTGVNQLGTGGRLAARLGGFAGRATSRVGGAIGQATNMVGGAIGQTRAGLGGIKRGLVSGFQGGRFGQSGADIASKLASRGVGQAGQVAAKFANVLGKGVTLLPKLLGPMMAVGASAFAATEAFKAAIEAVYNFEGRLKMAVEAGDVEKAKAVAGERASFQGANVVRAGGATAGAVVGMFLGGPIGAAIGAAIGAGLGTLVANLLPEGALDTLNEMFGGNTRASAIALAAAQAGAVKTQKELDKAQKSATNAMEDFEKGSITASEALKRIRAATAEVGQQEKRASEFAISNLKNRASDGFTGRNIASTLTFGMVESSSARNQRLGQESADQIRQAAKFQTEAFQMETGARSATIRSGFARGRSKAEIEAEATGNLRTRRTELLQNAQKALRAGDEQSANAFMDAANQLNEQIQQVEREMENLEKEVKRAKAAFDAMNLGLRGPTATATAMSASMTKFASGLEVGGSSFVTNTEFLSQAVTSAAQAMNPDDIKAAVSDVSKNLKDMGVSSTFVKKFEGNTSAFIQAQQKYNDAFANIRKRIGENAFQGLNADEMKKQFANELSGLLGPDIGEEAKQNLKAVIDNLNLSDAEIDQIISGQYDVFGEKLGEAGQKQFEEIMKIAQERQKAEQVIIQLTQQRIEAERNLVEAQKEAVDLYMEGRDVQAKYGGAAVTSGEKRAAILAKANAGASGAGIGQMRTGSVAELRARNAQIAGGFFGIERRRSVDGGMQGKSGVEADAMQKNLQQAQKDQVQTIRDLIKLEEEELKIIQEKNKLEKDSMESLISGDIDKFFEQQAAVGATAAIATGDMALANQFGAKAMGDAFKDIQRQQEAGVQSLYGRQLSGAGGLVESAAGAALGGRGITDPRMAQVLAGTTPEEEARKRNLQELGGVLGETGAWQQAMAEMQVQTAQINVSNAEVKLAEIEERGRTAAAGMYRGGVVYANRGIFVPRGTDTVPAMLTPGEFVVNRNAVNRGNNLQLLQAINNGGSANGLARGGKVGYYNNGGMVQYKADGGILGNIAGALGINPQMITNLGNIFTAFTNSFNESIRNLQDTKLQIKLDSVNVNVNLNGTSMLTQVTDATRTGIIKEVIQKLQSEYGVGSGGKLIENKGGLPRPGN